MLQHNKHFYCQGFLDVYILRYHRTCCIVDYLENKRSNILESMGYMTGVYIRLFECMNVIKHTHTIDKSLTPCE